MSWHTRLFGVIFLLLHGFQTAQCQETIMVTGHPNYPPFNWEQNGKITGASVELVTRIFAEKNIIVEPVAFGPWGRVQKAAQNNEFDLILGALKTEERQRYLLFIDEPYAVDPISIFIHKANADIIALQDLPGKAGAANRKESFGLDFDEYAASKLKLTRVTEIDQAFQMLSKRRIDYVIHGFYPSLVTLQRLGIDNIRHLRTFVSKPKAYQAFTRSSKFKSLAPWFAARVKHYRENGTIDVLVAKYLQLWSEANPIELSNGYRHSKPSLQGAK